MKYLSLAIILAFASNVTIAQTSPKPRTLHVVTDPQMVVDDRGAKLEVLPHERAQITFHAGNRQQVLRVAGQRPDKAFSSSEVGVVFNHSYQLYGQISGEISFQLKGNAVPGGNFSSSDYPKLKRVGTLNMYTLTASNPAQFIGVMRRLQSRQDVEWVVPTVSYSGF